MTFRMVFVTIVLASCAISPGVLCHFRISHGKLDHYGFVEVVMVHAWV